MFEIGIPIYSDFPKTQSEFESMCKEEAYIQPFSNFPSFCIKLSKSPYHYGHSIHPTGEYGSCVVSHSTKLKGLKKTTDWAVKNCLLN
jgi:hypothetical protein